MHEESGDAMNPRYVFVVNPFSGAGEGEKVARLLENLLSEHPTYRGAAQVIRIDRLESERFPGQLADAEFVVAAGGDGTVNCLLPHLVRCLPRPALALIPLGTSNDLARALGLPARREWAAESTLRTFLDSLLTARPARLDVVSVNGDLFFSNYFSIGLDAAIVRDFDDVRDSRWAAALPPARLVNNALYFLMGLKNAGFLLRPPIEIVTDKASERRVVITKPIRAIIVSNLPVYAGGCSLRPDARVDDGLFEITVVANAYQYLRVIATRFLKFLGRPRIAQYQASRAELRMSHPAVSQVDGEKGPPPDSLLSTLQISVHSSVSVLIHS